MAGSSDVAAKDISASSQDFAFKITQTFGPRNLHLIFSRKIEVTATAATDYLRP